MVEDKKVSIILCFYNEEKYLSKAIDSVLAQTYSNFELIIVNDGSTDGSDKIVKSYDDERIVYIAYEGNKRLAYARNRGLEAATGDYVGFFDADDIMMPDKMEKQVQYLNEHSDILVVSGGCIYMDENGNIDDEITLPMYFEDEQIRAYLLLGNCMAVGAALFRRAVVEKNAIRLDESNKASEDYGFWIKILTYGKFANMPEAFYKYRVNHGSKATLVVRQNESAYDLELENILREAWGTRGFSLEERDIRFITIHISRGKRALNPVDIIQGIRTYKKIKHQLKTLCLPEGELIIQYYKIHWMRNYHFYWFFKKIVSILRT